MKSRSKSTPVADSDQFSTRFHSFPGDLSESITEFDRQQITQISLNPENEQDANKIREDNLQTQKKFCFT